MGKGDKRTRRGKLFNRSYGKSRPHAKKAGAANHKKSYPKKTAAVKAPAAKTAATRSAPAKAAKK